MSTNQNRNTSQSPSPPRGFSNQLSMISAKINRALSGDRLAGRDSDSSSVNSADSTVGDGNSRSVSRGRQGYSSTGRGGLGNIRENDAGYDAGAVVRGRDRVRMDPSAAPPPPPAARSPSYDRPFSTGRGGVGNMRPLFPEPVLSDAASSRSFPTMGSFSPAPTITPGAYPNSRSLSRGPPLRMSTGRGGAGNIRSPSRS